MMFGLKPEGRHANRRRGSDGQELENRTGFLPCAVILPLVCCGALLFFQVFWGTPVGPLGPVLAYPFFTHPPASAEKPPRLPDASNVSDVGADALKTRTLEYETTASPSTVYDFYRDRLVKDGWGGKGYFSKPQLTNEGMTFEWDQAGPNGCETFGYMLQVFAGETTSTTTHVKLTVTEINPCR
jgi:hypothetical protein